MLPDYHLLYTWQGLQLKPKDTQVPLLAAAGECHLTPPITPIFAFHPYPYHPSKSFLIDIFYAVRAWAHTPRLCDTDGVGMACPVLAIDVRKGDGRAARPR